MTWHAGGVAACDRDRQAPKLRCCCKLLLLRLRLSGKTENAALTHRGDVVFQQVLLQAFAHQLSINDKIKGTHRVWCRGVSRDTVQQMVGACLQQMRLACWAAHISHRQQHNMCMCQACAASKTTELVSTALLASVQEPQSCVSGCRLLKGPPLLRTERQQVIDDL